MRSRLVSLGTVVRDARVNVAVGTILVITGLFETVNTGLEAFLGIDIGVEHGVIIFGAVSVVRGLQEILEGMERVVDQL